MSGWYFSVHSVRSVVRSFVRVAHCICLTLFACGPAEPAPAASMAPVTPKAATATASTAELVPEKLDVKAEPEIYEVEADGQALFDRALARARDENKRVLVTIGGNWCVWCHKLHMLFRRDPAIGARLERSYVEVKLDTVAHEAVITRLAPDSKAGVPFLFVLGPTGEVLTRQETGSLELGPRHDPAKVLAFLDAQAGA